MWTLGKFVVMTHDELEQRNNDARALGYRAGLRSKWKMKKIEPSSLPAPSYDLLAVIQDESIVLPQREA